MKAAQQTHSREWTASPLFLGFYLAIKLQLF
jgi:hypothetical protein